MSGEEVREDIVDKKMNMLRMTEGLSFT